MHSNVVSGTRHRVQSCCCDSSNSCHNASLTRRPLILSRKTAIFNKDLRSELKLRIGMVFTSRSELRRRSQDLARMAGNLRARGYEVSPDTVRSDIDRMLANTPGLGDLFPSHRVMKRTTRFHQHEFGRLLNAQTEVAEVRSMESAARFGDELERFDLAARNGNGSASETRTQHNAA